MAEFLLGEVLNRQPLHVQTVSRRQLGARRARLRGVPGGDRRRRERRAHPGPVDAEHDDRAERRRLHLPVSPALPRAAAVPVAGELPGTVRSAPRGRGEVVRRARRVRPGRGALRDRGQSARRRTGSCTTTRTTCSCTVDRPCSTASCPHSISTMPPRSRVERSTSRSPWPAAGAVEAAEHWIQRLERAGASLSATDSARFAAVRGLVAILQGDPVACEAALADVLTSGVHDPVVAGSCRDGRLRAVVARRSRRRARRSSRRRPTCRPRLGNR